MPENKTKTTTAYVTKNINGRLVTSITTIEIEEDPRHLKEPQEMATYLLSDGTPVTIPVENHEQTLQEMERRLAEFKKKRKHP